MQDTSLRVIPPVIALVLLLVCAGLSAAQERPESGIWWYFPVAHGTPQEPVPPDEELLEVVPPLREVPDFSSEAEDLGLALWWGDSSQILYSEQPPSEADLARAPALTTPPGEDEPLVLGLWGITRSAAVTLSVKDSPFPVTIRHVDFAPRYLPTPYRGVEVPGGRTMGFATFLPETGTSLVKPGENTVFWINVEVPQDAPAGDHSITLRLIIHQVQVMELTATVTVLPFALPRADIPYGMYFRWAGPKDSPRYRTPALTEAYWRDLARHGMTSVSLYMYGPDGDFIDAEGNVKPLDGHSTLRDLEKMREIGLIHADLPIMLLASNLARHPESARVLLEEFQERGLPELLLYGWDEPPVTDEARAAFEALRPVREHMRVTTAIHDHAAEAFGDLIDVWVVNGGRITPAIRALAQEKGQELWTYDCNHRGRGNATRARFYAGLYTWALELRGNFIWCYTEGYSWEGDRNSIFNFVLPSDAGPVPSVAWEARREGVEDYRTLRLLETRIAADPTSPPAQEAAQWLEEIRGRVNWDLIQGMPKSVYPWDGAEVFPMCPDFDPGELSLLRARAQEYILTLGG